MFNDGSVILALVAILGSSVAALVWVIKTMFDRILPAIDGLTKATASNTRATKSADTYLRNRNGRDAKIHTELLSATKEIPQEMRKIADEQAEALITSLKELPAQKIKHQEVGVQNVNKTRDNA